MDRCSARVARQMTTADELAQYGYRIRSCADGIINGVRDTLITGEVKEANVSGSSCFPVL